MSFNIFYAFEIHDVLLFMLWNKYRNGMGSLYSFYLIKDENVIGCF